MKICYIAPVLSFATQEAVSILAQVSSMIYSVGFGICGAVAFIQIFRTAIKCHREGSYVELGKVAIRCFVGIGMLIAAPYIMALIDAMFRF